MVTGSSKEGREVGQNEFVKLEAGPGVGRKWI